jgi:hypothetical protein
MNENKHTESAPSSDEASRPLAVALASMIVGAMDTAVAVVDLIDKRRTHEPTGRAEPAREALHQRAQPARAIPLQDFDEDEIPVTTLKPNVAEISLEDWGNDEDDADDNTVEVRVSPQAQRARPARSAGERARSLAQALVETANSELGDYIESSPAFDKLIRARTERVLRELAADPEQLEPLMRAQSDAALAHLLAHPEKLEPLFEAFAQYQARNSPPERFPPTLPKR